MFELSNIFAHRASAIVPLPRGEGFLAIIWFPFPLGKGLGFEFRCLTSIFAHRASVMCRHRYAAAWMPYSSAYCPPFAISAS